MDTLTRTVLAVVVVVLVVVGISLINKEEGRIFGETIQLEDK